jgi:hypothetical protein
MLINTTEKLFKITAQVLIILYKCKIKNMTKKNPEADNNQPKNKKKMPEKIIQRLRICHQGRYAVETRQRE